jgi:hypothetical protein
MVIWLYHEGILVVRRTGRSISVWITGSCLDVALCCHVFFLSWGLLFKRAGPNRLVHCRPRLSALPHSTLSGVACSNLSLAYQPPDESKGLYSTPEPEPLATRCSLSWAHANRFGPKGGTERRPGDPTAARPAATVAACDHEDDYSLCSLHPFSLHLSESGFPFFFFCLFPSQY